MKEILVRRLVNSEILFRTTRQVSMNERIRVKKTGFLKKNYLTTRPWVTMRRGGYSKFEIWGGVIHFIVNLREFSYKKGSPRG